MSLFVFDIGDKSRKAGRALGDMRSELQKAFIAEQKSRKLTQQKIATQLGVNRSVVHRQLTGIENLTYRTIVELAWAMGWEPQFSLVKHEQQRGENEPLTFLQSPSVTGTAQPVIEIIGSTPRMLPVFNGSAPNVLLTPTG